MSPVSSPDVGQGAWAAVLGSPVGHSLSPALHEAAYRELGATVRYRRLETPGPSWAPAWPPRPSRAGAATP